eukprot:364851-Chlamydomonas_euryale.AAC.1
MAALLCKKWEQACMPSTHPHQYPYHSSIPISIPLIHTDIHITHPYRPLIHTDSGRMGRPAACRPGLEHASPRCVKPTLGHRSHTRTQAPQRRRRVWLGSHQPSIHTVPSRRRSPLPQRWQFRSRFQAVTGRARRSCREGTRRAIQYWGSSGVRSKAREQGVENRKGRGYAGQQGLRV